MALKTAAKFVEAVPDAPKVSRFQEEDSLPGKNTSLREFDQELLDTLTASKEQGKSFSVDVTDFPPSRGKQNAKTTENYLRAHATHLGIGVSVRALANGRVGFQGGVKKIVPSGMARKPRRSKAEMEAARSASGA